jgi:hypothetical protein
MNNNKHGYGMVLDATEKYNIRQQKKFWAFENITVSVASEWDRQIVFVESGLCKIDKTTKKEMKHQLKNGTFATI